MWLENYIDGRLLTGNAGFASDEEIARCSVKMTESKVPENSRAIFPVKSDANGMRMIDSHEAHSLVVGVSGAGKTRRILVPAISAAMRAKDKPSLFIYDVKGELSLFCEPLARREGYQVVSLDLINPECSDGFDVLRQANDAFLRKDMDACEQALAALAAAICMPPPPGSPIDPFWSSTGQAGIVGVALYMLEDSKNPITLPKLVNKLTDVLEEESTTRNFVRLAEKKFGSECTMLRNLKSAFSGSEKTLMNVTNCLLADCSQFLKVSSLAAITNKPHPKGLTTMVDKPTVIFFKTSESTKELHSFAKLVFTQLYTELCRIAGPGKLARPFEFFLDEVCNAARIDQLPTMMAVCRSKGIRLHLCTQSLKQLTAMYFENADTIRSNCSLLFVARNSDPNTWELTSELAGVDIRGHKLMPPRMLAHLPTGRALVLTAHNLPYMADLCDFTELPWFKK